MNRRNDASAHISSRWVIHARASTSTGPVPDVL